MAEKNINPVKIYQWDAPSLITRIDVRAQGKSGFVAYIHAAPAEEERLRQLHELREEFRQKGWTTSSDTRDGRSVLRLTGLKNENDLTGLLQNGRYIEGAPHITQAASSEKPKSAKDKIRSNSLQASGIVYMIGNAIYVISGFARGKNWGQIGTGLSFATGDILLALVGGKDDKSQFKILLKKLKDHLETQGIEIPPNSAIDAETTTRGEKWSEKAYDFAHEHISKIKALAEVSGGVNYWFSGKKDNLPWKQRTAVIFGLGSTLFIKEKKPDKEKLKHAGTLEKAKAFVQEKPLRVGGWSGFSNTLFTTISAFQERAVERIKPGGGSKNYRYDWAAAGTMFFGNSLYALSNKTMGDSSITEEGLIRDVYGIAAQVLNRVPEQQREAAFKATVDFLGERIEIKDSREQIEALLLEQMNRSTHNPWFKARELTQTPSGQEPKWEKIASISAPKQGKWEEFIAQPSGKLPEQAPAK